MQERELFQSALGLSPPWRVVRSEFDAAGRRLDMYLDFAPGRRFAWPDIGLVSMSEVADTLGAIAERAAIPLIVDSDTGFGNALNVMRTVKLFANRGAPAIQLEDQTTPKRCGHLAEKRVVPRTEMVGKLKAALDARPSAETLIIARTDAIAVEGFGP